MTALVAITFEAIRVLKLIRDGRNPYIECLTPNKVAGRNICIKALVKHGWVEHSDSEDLGPHWVLTDAGREFLQELAS